MKIRFKLTLILIGIIVFFRCSMISEVRKQDIVKGPEFTPYCGLKTTIAVMEFDAHGGSEKIGSAIADMLISLLVRSGRFIVLERQSIDIIFKEQTLGQTGTLTEESATEVGKLLGVQSLVVGEILEAVQQTGSHEFGDDDDEEDDEKKDPWALALKATVGHVKLNYRVLDTATGEIILSDHVSTTEIRPGFGIKTKKVDVTDTFEFDETVLGLVMRKAVNLMVEQIVQSVDRVQWRGRVVHVKEDSLIYFTPGLNSGLQMGDTFLILGNDEEMISDEEVPLTEPVEKATVQIIGFVGDKVAKAILLTGASVIRGDRVRVTKKSAEF